MFWWSQFVLFEFAGKHSTIASNMH